jgi:hypothetical protein
MTQTKIPRVPAPCGGDDTILSVQPTNSGSPASIETRFLSLSKFLVMQQLYASVILVILRGSDRYPTKIT